MAHLYSDIDPAMLTAVARGIIAEEDRAVNTQSLTPWFPSLETSSIRYELPTGTTRTFTEAAPYRAFDTPAPVGDRPGRGWAQGRLAPISMKYILGEEDQINIRQMVAAGTGIGELDDILDDVARGVRAIINRNQLAMSELIVDGNLTLNERGMQLTYDPGRNANRESTLAGGAAWDQPTTATPFANERAALAVLKAYGLEWSDLYVLTNQATWDAYSAIDEVVDTYNSVRVLPRLSEEQVVEVRSMHRLPEVLVNDSSIRSYGAVASAKVIPDGAWLYVPKFPIGRSQYAPTVAATSGKVPLSNTAAPGVVAYVMDEADPISLETVVDAITIPTMTEPDATYSLTVF